MDYLSSMYIDNEMTLTEKKQFVEKVRSDQAFCRLTLDLLAQEQLIQAQPAMPEPEPEKKWPPARVSLANFLNPLGFSAAGFAAGVLILLIFFQPPVPSQSSSNRFILFKPGAGQVELAGTFTGWQRISMKQIGNSGYWELNLPIATGEHRFAYILDNNRQIADPTLPFKEKDDFGGENSILNIAERT